MARREQTKQVAPPVHVVEMANLVTLPGLGHEVSKVAAIMFHPNDIAARRTYVASADRIMKYLLEDIKPSIGKVIIQDPPRDSDALSIESLLDSVTKGVVGKESGTDTYPGSVFSAMILGRAIALTEEGWPEAGISQILNEQSELFRRAGIGRSGRDVLTDTWLKHRASAHLALAFYEKSRKPKEIPGDFYDWIGRARDLRKLGVEIGSRFSKPILPPEECWEIVLGPTAGG